MGSWRMDSIFRCQTKTSNNSFHSAVEKFIKYKKIQPNISLLKNLSWTINESVPVKDNDWNCLSKLCQCFRVAKIEVQAITQLKIWKANFKVIVKPTISNYLGTLARKFWLESLLRLIGILWNVKTKENKVLLTSQHLHFWIQYKISYQEEPQQPFSAPFQPLHSAMARPHSIVEASFGSMPTGLSLYELFSNQMSTSYQLK